MVLITKTRAVTVLVLVFLAMLVSAVAPAQVAGSPAARTPGTPAQPAFAQPVAPQPFGQPSPAFGAPPIALRAGGDPGFLERIQTSILETQQQLHRDLAKAVRDLKSDPFRAGLTLVLLSFVYGVLHAAGPGHGKAIISSYVLANRQTARRAVMISFASAFVQGCSAVALVLGLGVILNAAGLRMQAAVAQMETASFALVALVGAWLFAGQMRRVAGKLGLGERLRGWLAPEPRPPLSLSAAAVEPGHGAHGHRHAHTHSRRHHDDECGCGHAHVPPPQALDGRLSWRKTAAVIFAVGVRPCTGAVLVLVFALTQGLFLTGVVSTFAMAIGTAITVSALTLAAVGARDLTARLAAGGGGRLWAEAFYDILAIGGTFLIFAIGVVLFLGSLGPAKPF